MTKFKERAEANQDNPFFAGHPVAFVFTPPKHPESFQVRQSCDTNKPRPGSMCTSDFEQFAEHIRGIEGGVIYVTRAQLREMFEAQDAGWCRPLNDEEIEAIGV